MERDFAVAAGDDSGIFKYDDFLESDYIEVTIVPDTTQGQWHNMQVGEEHDNCGNTLSLTFNSNTYCFWYNGQLVGHCPFLGGINTIRYCKTNDDMRFHSTWHRSCDNTNDGGYSDEGTKYKYDWVIWTYDCILDPGNPDENCREDPNLFCGDDLGTLSMCEHMPCNN